MDEKEWRCGKYLQPKMEFLQGKLSFRRSMLFATACCRRVYTDMPASYYQALEALEACADKRGIRPSGIAIRERFDLGDPRGLPYSCEKRAAMVAVYWATRIRARCSYIPWIVADSVRTAEMQHSSHQMQRCTEMLQVKMLQDIHRYKKSAPLKPEWLAGDVRAIALETYKERFLPYGELAPLRLGVLSDALEENGCDDVALLGHLRSPGPHIRGCWALDLILGRK